MDKERNEERNNETIDAELETELVVLAAARELVQEQGEANFRIADLVEKSGRSVGAIYHSFGNREGVLEAVWIQQLSESWELDAARLQTLVATITSPEDLDVAIVLLARELHDPERADELWAKLEVIAACRRRPVLRRVVERAQQSMTDAYTSALQDLQRRGLVCPELDARAVAVFVQAFTLGRIVGELGGTSHDDFNGWVEVVRRALTGALTPISN